MYSFFFQNIYVCRYISFLFLYGYTKHTHTPYIYDHILICNWDCRGLCLIRAALLSIFLCTFLSISSHIPIPSLHRQIHILILIKIGLYVALSSSPHFFGDLTLGCQALLVSLSSGKVQKAGAFLSK